MSMELTLLSAFLVGLLGSIHCVGMCGGIAAALTMGLPAQVRQSPLRIFPYLLSYNAGRLASYTAAGTLFGLLGAQSATLLPTQTARTVGMIISAAFLIALGLYLGGWWQALSFLERQGARFWRRIEPIGRRFLPVKHPAHALGVGLIWGWLPCGLVYAALAWSLTAGSAFRGGLLMLAFGLGTVPMLFTLGAASRWLHRLTRRLVVRRAVGTLVILFGVYALVGVQRHHMHLTPPLLDATSNNRDHHTH
jgi:sulfite exporter TauE/SafE